MCSSARRQMHARNIFRTPPDYTALAIKYKEFREVCKLELTGKVCVDYKKEAALRALTQMLLREYYQLSINFAPGSLIPTLPLRLNYILWIEDLLLPMNVDGVRGIDIGCGSSCIYSLLGAKKNAWEMFALESNTVNVKFAEQNIEANDLQILITIFPQTNKSVIFKDFLEKLPTATETFHFCLCNPPFYDSSLPNPFSSTTRNPAKRPPPHSCHTGRTEELACPGGEVQFVRRIIEESLLYKQRICIFTSMLGHKSSLTKIIEMLENLAVTNFCATEFCQGRTTRWGVAWSFMDNVNLRQVPVC